MEIANPTHDPRVAMLNEVLSEEQKIDYILVDLGFVEFYDRYAEGLDGVSYDRELLEFDYKGEDLAKILERIALKNELSKLNKF